MDGWFVENSVGAYPPFLQRNIKRRPEFHMQKVPEQECSSIEILDLDSDFDSYQMRGYVKTPYAVVPVEIRMRDPIVLFSCFDELFVYVFASRDTKVCLFSAEITCCQNWGAGVFKAHEMCLFGAREPAGSGDDRLRIKCRIRNLRDAGTYHYNVQPPARQESLFFTVRLRGTEYRAVQYTCILCFLRFERAELLVEHINISHCRYSCEYRDRVLCVHAEGLPQDLCGAEDAKRAKRSPGETPGARRHPVSFLRRSAASGKSAMVGYELKNHKMLIEREYDTQDYSRMLARHANADMNLADDTRERPIAEEWNRLRIANADPRGCFRAILRRFDLSMEVVRLAEILYKKGVLNSGEILDALDDYQTKH